MGLIDTEIFYKELLKMVRDVLEEEGNTGLRAILDTATKAEINSTEKAEIKSTEKQENHIRARGICIKCGEGFSILYGEKSYHYCPYCGRKLHLVW